MNDKETQEELDHFRKSCKSKTHKLYLFSFFFQVTFGVMNEMEFVLFALIKPSIDKMMIKLFQREMLSFLRGFMRKWQSWPETHC